MTKSGKLYIVPTPIGNLEDMTLKAIRVLKEAELILAEDTRTSLRLLEHYGIKNVLKSHHKFNEHGTVRDIAVKIEAGISVALISDAGTPGISDPGFLLVRTCLENGIEVECLPGATAFVPALVNSGFPCDRFVFEGFLPQKKGRQKRLSALVDEKRTIILYESPFRLVKLLEEMSLVFGNDRKCCVCRELTKIYEENVRGTIAEVLGHFREKQPKGEIVVVVEGKGKNDLSERSDLSEGENEETEGLSDRVRGRLRD
jgi:16S rRNA (cytidine1402-2'-O)-methyltransferase